MSTMSNHFITSHSNKGVARAVVSTLPAG